MVMLMVFLFDSYYIARYIFLFGICFSELSIWKFSYIFLLS